MIDRFTGADGTRVVTETLSRQHIVQGDSAIAAELQRNARIIEFKPGDTLIRQADSTSDVLFLMAGEVTVVVHGREVAIRKVGQTVGEMALIDPSKPRSATVTAKTLTVAAVVSERDFTPIAQRFPQLWRRMALDLSDRVRDRDRLVRPRNSRSKVFIGCSAEALTIAKEFQTHLSHADCIPQVWTDDFFTPSATSIENIVKGIEEADFAVLVFTADDVVRSRGTEYAAPRDNVVYELGHANGAIGRTRVFILQERGVALKFPSDLFGVTPLDFASGTPADLNARLAPAAHKMSKVILTLGPR